MRSTTRWAKRSPIPGACTTCTAMCREWVLDQYTTDFYAKLTGVADNPLCVATKIYPRVVRGGSWDDDPDMLA